MPFIHITSLAQDSDFDAPSAVRAVSADFARETGVAEEHVTVTWQRLTAHVQGGHDAPDAILIDLHAPDFNSAEQVETMLRAAAAAAAREAGVPPDRVFASFRPARSRQVYDGGEIVRW